MKCFFTLTDGVEGLDVHLNMLRVACKTANENTSLDLYALYDGSEKDEAYKIFIENNVKVTLCKCSFEDKVLNYYNNLDKNIVKSGVKRLLGCFMKFDISLYASEDENVLYTDIDTIFMKDVDWNAFNVKTIAVAPEFNQNYDIFEGNRYFNAGIMMINISELKKRREKLFEMLDNQIPPYVECLDQGFWNELYKDDFEEWGLEFNWKPYWGYNKDACIVHLYGVKPDHFTTSTFSQGFSVYLKTSAQYNGYLQYHLKHYIILDNYKKNLGADHVSCDTYNDYVVKLVSFLNKSKQIRFNDISLRNLLRFYIYQRIRDIDSKFTKKLKSKLLAKGLIDE